jgi:hypothetical protein
VHNFLFSSKNPYPLLGKGFFILIYSVSERSYLAIVEKTMVEFESQGFERVDINRVEGYLKTEGSAESVWVIIII